MALLDQGQRGIPRAPPLGIGSGQGLLCQPQLWAQAVGQLHQPSVTDLPRWLRVRLWRKAYGVQGRVLGGVVGGCGGGEVRAW